MSHLLLSCHGKDSQCRSCSSSLDYTWKPLHGEQSISEQEFEITWNGWDPKRQPKGAREGCGGRWLLLQKGTWRGLCQRVSSSKREGRGSRLQGGETTRGYVHGPHKATAAILWCEEGGNCRTASFNQAKLHHNAHPRAPGLALGSRAGSVIGSPPVLSCSKLPWYLKHNLPSLFWCVTCDWGCGSAIAVGEYQWLMGIIQTNVPQSSPVVSYFFNFPSKWSGRIYQGVGKCGVTTLWGWKLRL